MNLVARYSDVESAEEAAMLLKSHGIPTHVSSSGIKSLKHFIHSNVEAGLWVLIDRQVDDALKVLEDPDHKVTTGLSRDELLELSTNAESRVFDTLNKGIMYGVGIIIIAVIFIIQFGVFK